MVTNRPQRYHFLCLHRTTSCLEIKQFLVAFGLAGSMLELQRFSTLHPICLGVNRV